MDVQKGKQEIKKVHLGEPEKVVNSEGKYVSLFPIDLIISEAKDGEIKTFVLSGKVVILEELDEAVKMFQRGSYDSLGNVIS